MYIQKGPSARNPVIVRGMSAPHSCSEKPKKPLEAYGIQSQPPRPTVKVGRRRGFTSKRAKWRYEQNPNAIQSDTMEARNSSWVRVFLFS